MFAYYCGLTRIRELYIRFKYKDLQEDLKREAEREIERDESVCVPC